MNYDVEKVYEGYAREEIEDIKQQLENKFDTDGLKAFFQRTEPAGFLEEHGLTWINALEKIAAAEILQKRGLEIPYDADKCKSIYEGYAKQEIENLKIQMKRNNTAEELQELLNNSEPASFLEEHGLIWRNALDKIAAAELLESPEYSEINSSGISK